MATMCTLTSRSDACLRHPRTVHLHYMHMPENSRTRGVLSSRESGFAREKTPRQKQTDYRAIISPRRSCTLKSALKGRLPAAIMGV